MSKKLAHIYYNTITSPLCNVNVSAAGQSLSEQYWATMGTEGVRLFVYQPGSEPDIAPEYENKIMGYETGIITILLKK